MIPQNIMQLGYYTGVFYLISTERIFLAMASNYFPRRPMIMEISADIRAPLKIFLLTGTLDNLGIFYGIVANFLRNFQSNLSILMK